VCEDYPNLGQLGTAVRAACPSVLYEETLFLKSVVSTDGREHPLGVGDRDLIFKLRAHVPVRGPVTIVKQYILHSQGY
jgi:hypothetical protein